MRIRISFDTRYELTVKLFDTDFVGRWCRLLDQEIARGSLMQEHTYSNFAPESLAKQRLEQAIDTVNKFLKREFISMPCASDYDDRDFYNRLHEKFEQLAGPSWESPTRLMLAAPKEIQFAIKSINRWCHRLENRPYRSYDYIRFEFESINREALRSEDYDLFRSDSATDVATLDYSTLGKSLRECYEDGLSSDYNGMKIQQHYSSNFKLHTSVQGYNNAGFINWCAEQNINPVPKTELGQLWLGNIEQPDWYEEVKKTAKIVSINLE